MRCPTLADLPPPPLNKTGWPWTEESPQLFNTMPSGSPWPRISIVTGTYNRVNFVEETIRAVLLQGYPDLEYIIIDGESTDGTIDVVQKYRQWIAYFISEKDKGEYEAISKGFKKCTGDIITFNSSDDRYFPGTFGRIGSSYHEDTAYGAFVGGFVRMDSHSKITSPHIPARLPFDAPVDLSTIDPSSWRLHQQSTFYSARALDDVGRYVREDLRSTGDRDLLYRVAKRYKIMTIGEPLSAFRVHEGSLSSSSLGRFNSTYEYAKLQKEYSNTGDGQDYQRRRIYRRLLAKAFYTRAKYTGRGFDALWHLVLAGILRPEYLTNKNYLGTWWGLYRFIFKSRVKG